MERLSCTVWSPLSSKGKGEGEGSFWGHSGRVQRLGFILSPRVERSGEKDRMKM